MKGIPKLRTYIFLLFFCSLFYETASAQSTAVPFLLYSPNARMTSMGESGVALADDATAAFLNPAGLGFQTGQESNLTYTGWLPQFQIRNNYDYEHLIYTNGSYRINIPEIGGTFAAAMAYFDLENVDIRTANDDKFTISSYEYAISISYGTPLFNDLAVGLGVRYLRSVLIPRGTEMEVGSGIESAISGDIGILYRPLHVVIPFTQIDLSKRLGVGLALTNMGPSVSYIDEAQADPLPTNLRVGIAFDFIQSQSHKVTWTFDVNKLIISRTGVKADPLLTALTRTWTTKSNGQPKNIGYIIHECNFGTGVEYTYSDFIALRGGYFYEDPDFGDKQMFTFGAGFRYDIFGLDLSFISMYGHNNAKNPVISTCRATLSVNWDKDISRDNKNEIDVSK